MHFICITHSPPQVQTCVLGMHHFMQCTKVCTLHDCISQLGVLASCARNHARSMVHVNTCSPQTTVSDAQLIGVPT